MGLEAQDFLETDQLEGVPHPRHTLRLFGHEAAEAEILAAFASGRMPHGWLLAGPRGVGKATLAWRFARAALAFPPGGESPRSLDLPADHPVVRRVAALSEPSLALIRRGIDERSGRPRTQITIDEVRRLREFFALSAPDGGRRVVIIDAADEMTTAAANALLKLLEEPPEGALLLLVAHRPQALLPTIRSRCRLLRLGPLGAAALSQAVAQALATPPENPEALAALAAGSVGEAVRLVVDDGLGLYARLVQLVAELPTLDRRAVHELATVLTERAADRRLELGIRLFETLLARLAHAAATGSLPAEAAPGEAALARRLGLSPAFWAEHAALLPARARNARALNIDPAAIVIDMLIGLQAATKTAEAQGAERGL